MLELRSHCENCAKPLPPTSTDAMICTFECTFCSDCVTIVLENVCPNCGGGFEKRPVRPAQMLSKYPAQNESIIKPIDWSSFETIQSRNKSIPPKNR